MRTAKFIPALEQVGSKLERLPKEGFRIVVHLALAIHHAEIQVRIQRGLPIEIQTDHARQLFNRLTVPALFQQQGAHRGQCQGIGGVTRQHTLQGGQRLVGSLLQHLRPPQQRLGLVATRCQLQGPTKGELRPGGIVK